ncbi:hypothetical protein, partial [uncultured Gammaproteobacteria bacterium]
EKHHKIIINIYVDFSCLCYYQSHGARNHRKNRKNGRM